MKTAVRPALLAAVPLLAVVPLLAGPSAHADSSRPATDATCVMKAHGTFSTAVDPGGTNTAGRNTLRMTGTVECEDPAGARVATGTIERTVTMPGTECTGDEHGDTSTTRVTWADGAVSTFAFTHTDVVKADGTASLVATGSVTADSARFANDTIDATGTSTGSGCGTADGESAVDSTLVLRLTH